MEINLSNFHSKYNNKTQVLTLYKAIKGIKFGGNTHIGFDCSRKWKKDLKSFIFSLDKRKIYNSIGDNQVGCYKQIIPSFGLKDVAIFYLIIYHFYPLIIIIQIKKFLVY